MRRKKPRRVIGPLSQHDVASRARYPHSQGLSDVTLTFYTPIHPTLTYGNDWSTMALSPSDTL
jgi:hypothetical protein